MSNAGELDGTWDVHRVSGALPPMWGVRKRIEGARGATLLGPLAVPFDVVGLELRYRGPLRGLVDVLEPSMHGYVGRSLLFGCELGRFELRQRRGSAHAGAAAT